MKFKLSHLTMLPLLVFMYPIWVCAEIDSDYNARSDFAYRYDHRTWHIEADGRFTREADEIVEVLTGKGVEKVGQHAVSYNASMEALEVLEAFTETPDGKKLPVAKDKIVVEKAPQSPNAQMFADFKVTTIVFPQVEVGSRLHYRYRQTQLKPLFPGEFAQTEYQFPHVLSEDAKVAVIAPKGMKLTIDVSGYTGGAVACPRSDANRQCYEWAMKNLTYLPIEPSSVDPRDYSSHIAISTFPNYDAVAKAYLAHSHDKSEVTPKIQEMADNLTKGIEGKSKQTEAIYNWVAHHIRYVAVYLGAGSVVPHTADSVLANRYGDCKDHVVLLEALLKAKGIESAGVLVNARESYVLPKLPSLEVFNHIITYIPGMRRYVDSTAQFAMFGNLPAQELGKPALILVSEKGSAKVDTIPIPPAMTLRSNVVVRLKTTEDGTVEGHAEVADHGYIEMLDRAILASISEGQEAVVANRVLAATGQSGSGKFDIGEPYKLSQPYTYSTNFILPNLVHLPGPGAFTVPTGFHSMGAISGIGLVTALPKRNFAMAGCVDTSHHEDYEFELPKSIKVTGLPKDTSIKVPIGTYSGTYRLNGNVLHVVREMTTTTGSATCTPIQYQELRAFALDVAKDLRAQVLYQ